MIFDYKSIGAITDDEIDAVVEKHIAERQHLEFKMTVESKKDDKKIEFLHDIISFANSDGGYIIVGIRDDGKGCALRYEPKLVGDVDAIKKRVMSWCHDHIRERIEGLEIMIRAVKNNPLVIIRIPDSARKPHMVVCNNRTDFYTRYQDGKREMIIDEIREIFVRDEVGLRLLRIEEHLNKLFVHTVESSLKQELIEKMEKGDYPDLSTLENSKILITAADKRFEDIVNDVPYFRLSITPSNPKQNYIDIDAAEIRDMFKNPPGSRRNGWNMEDPCTPVKRVGMSLIRGDETFEYLELHSNGHLEFWSPLGQHFCWKQSESEFQTRPRLYPYPVVEYPTTFLRLYRALIDIAGIKDDFQFNMYYRNVKGYRLLPYAPNSVGFMFRSSEIEPYKKDHIHIGPKRIAQDFISDKIAFDIILSFYATFDYESDVIPFYDKEKGEFGFPS